MSPYEAKVGIFSTCHGQHATGHWTKQISQYLANPDPHFVPHRSRLMLCMLYSVHYIGG